MDQLNLQAIIEAVQAIGVPALVVLLIVAYMRDRGQADSNTEKTLAQIASNSTSQIIDVHKDLGNLRQELGSAEGKVSVLQETVTKLQSERDSIRDELQDVKSLLKRQSEIIEKHVTQIADLERKLAEKDAKIMALEVTVTEKDAEISRLTQRLENYKAQIVEIGNKNKELSKPIDLDATILLPELDNTNELPPIQDKPEESNDNNKKDAA